MFELEALGVKNRRAFLANCLTMGSIFCLGPRLLLAQADTNEKQAADAIMHKFRDNVSMTYAQVFTFAYANYIKQMKALDEIMGEKKLIEMLKTVGSKIAEESGKKWAEKLPNNDLASFLAVLKKPDEFWRHALTFDFVKDTESECELKVTECLWAKTFKEHDAADLGYACVCNSDYAMVKAFNPKLELTRSKTLMQGYDCCNHRYVMKA